MYSSFVKRTIDLLYEYIDMPRKNLSCFGEGRIHDNYSTLQDYSVLSGKEAEYFVSLIREFHDIFNVEVSDYEATPSTLTGLKYSHSCYPKNLRRWMKGTVSRKKKCRVEFVGIAVCWAMDWGNDAGKNYECRKGLIEMCEEMLEEKLDTNDNSKRTLVESMWKACNKCYMNK